MPRIVYPRRRRINGWLLFLERFRLLHIGEYHMRPTELFTDAALEWRPMSLADRQRIVPEMVRPRYAHRVNPWLVFLDHFRQQHKDEFVKRPRDLLKAAKLEWDTKTLAEKEVYRNRNHDEPMIFPW